MASYDKNLYIIHPVVYNNELQYISTINFCLTQLACMWQHVSAYYKAIIRPSIDSIDQLCTIMIARMGSHKLTGIFKIK
jgi:hypothetical protein